MRTDPRPQPKNMRRPARQCGLHRVKHAVEAGVCFQPARCRMSYRSALVLMMAVACCNAQFALAQAKGKQKGFGGADPPFRTTSPFGASRVLEDAQTPAPAFLVTLEERTKERKVFLTYIESAIGGPGGAVQQPFAGVPRGAAQEPFVATVYAVRRIQGEEPAKAYVYIGLPRLYLHLPEEDARKIIQ